MGNIVIDAEDAGVLITGPVLPDHQAILDRANTSSGSYVFELNNADGVTLDYLGMTGGYYAVIAGNSSDSDNVTISNSEMFDNDSHGVWLRSSNDGAEVINNVVHGHSTGVYVEGYQITVSGNAVFDNSTGIYSIGDGSTIDGNRVYNNNMGIEVRTGSTTSEQTSVANNRVFDNWSLGIQGSRNVLVGENRVYGHNGTGDIGILVSDYAEAFENTVFGNYIGLQAGWGYSDAVATGNTVYNNSNIGILTHDESIVRENTVYDNAIGIQGDFHFRGLMENNSTYDNADQGILIREAYSNPRVWNNTVHQPMGDAVRVEDSSSNVQLSTLR